MDIKQYDGDEVKVTVTIARTYTFTTTPAAIREGLPADSVGIVSLPDVQDAADVVYAMLARDTLHRDAWVAEMATGEGVEDESLTIEETSLA